MLCERTIFAIFIIVVIVLIVVLIVLLAVLDPLRQSRGDLSMAKETLEYVQETVVA